MNKPNLHQNERDSENRMTKKLDLNEMKVITYNNKVHVPFRCLDHRSSIVKRVLFRVILY